MWWLYSLRNEIIISLNKLFTKPLPQPTYTKKEKCKVIFVDKGRWQSPKYK